MYEVYVIMVHFYCLEIAFFLQVVHEGPLLKKKKLLWVVESNEAKTNDLRRQVALFI